MDTFRNYSKFGYPSYPGYPKVTGYFINGLQKPVYKSTNQPESLSSEFDLFDDFEVETKPKQVNFMFKK